MTALGFGFGTVAASFAAITCLYQGMWWSGAILGVVAYALAYVLLRDEP